MQSHDLHAVFISSICTPEDYLNDGKTIQKQSVAGNFQLWEHQQDLKMLKLAFKRSRETARLTIFTLVFREVSYILPRLPHPAQANEHLSQPPSACIISKLDVTVKETFAAALLPSGF